MNLLRNVNKVGATLLCAAAMLGGSVALAGYDGYDGYDGYGGYDRFGYGDYGKKFDRFDDVKIRDIAVTRKRGSLKVWAELWGHSYDDLEVRIEAFGYVDRFCINPGGNIAKGHTDARPFVVKDRFFLGKLKGRKDVHVFFDLDRDFNKHFHRFDWGSWRCPGPHKAARRVIFDHLEFKIVDGKGRGYGFRGFRSKLAKAECWFDDFGYGFDYGYRGYGFDNQAFCDIYY